MFKTIARPRLPIALMTLGLSLVLVAAACTATTPTALPAGPAAAPAAITPNQQNPTLAPASTATASEVPTDAPVAASPTTGATTDPSAASTDTPPAATATSGTPAVSFARDVLPIIQTNCTRCHGDSRPVAGLDLNGYAQIQSYASYGLVVPGDPANSILMEIISYGMMPPGGASLSPQDQQTISNWILAGAPNN